MDAAVAALASLDGADDGADDDADADVGAFDSESLSTGGAVAILVLG